ncbi:MAG: general secretion pathway protein GspB [Gammaproteobacteria bacterium]|nr:general secretion pathway protein GspB [Gammaproteobacteria bacterium]
MSYILSALKKVEHKRRSEQLPDLLSAHVEPAAPPAARRRTLMKTVVITGLLLAAGAWFLPSAGGQRTLAWMDEQWSSMPFSDWMPASSGDARRQAAAPDNALNNGLNNAPNKPVYKTVQVREFSPLDNVPAVQDGRAKFPEPLGYVAPPPPAAGLAPLKPPHTGAPPRAVAPPAAAAPVATPAAPPSSLRPSRTAAPQPAMAAPAAPPPAAAPPAAAPAATLLTPAAPQPAAAAPAAPPSAALLTPAGPVDFDSLPPDTRRRIPAFSVTGHLYSNVRPQANKVIINGAALREGQYVNEDLMVSEITGDGVILDFRGLHFLIAKARIFQ